ncbi:MAG TPA: hypothetical protein VFP19_06395, partial [Candidatus Limnocylindrales bacterium]|nr:hypothetical protein [Candidatus Limnocylindrales bacterium]
RQTRDGQLPWRQVDRYAPAGRQGRKPRTLRHDPLADRDDQAGLFRERDEVARMEETLSVVPAEQRLGPDDTVIGQVDQGLEGERELARSQRMAKVGLELEPGNRGLAMAVREDGDLAAAEGLCAV